jgi:signal transduction histidine kinase
MLKHQAERRGVTLTVEAAGGLPPAIVDGRQIYNAVYNLMLNAIDACEEGDAVTFRCHGVPDGEFPGGNCVIMECMDTGPGIPGPIMAKLFTDEVVTTKPMGTGLGTRIVKDVVDVHGGTVEVESEVGVGTTIRCRIPLERGAGNANTTS